MLPIRTILHATDFSAHAAYAFRLTCALARDYGARLVLIHVKPLPMLAGGDFRTIVPPEPPRVFQELQKELAALRPADRSIPVEHQLREGDAASEIIRLAGECKCDLIVLGTHGRTGLDRLVIGSVAEDVLRKASCPVLAVKVPIPEAAPTKAAPTSGAVRT